MTHRKMQHASRSGDVPSRGRPAAAGIPDWVYPVVVCALALAAYANTIGLGVAYDGHFLVEQDQRIRALGAENLKLILRTDYWWPLVADRLYRPLTTLSFLVNYTILGNGPNPAGYHAINLLLHAGNALLAFALALRVLGRRVPAFFAAALWAVHPIGTETVANIAGRADLLSAMALLAGLLLYIRVAQQETRSWPTVGAVFVLATLGSFAKETGAVLVGLMLLWDLAFARGKAWTAQRIAAYGAAVIPAVVMFFVRSRVFAGLPWPEELFVINPLRGAGFVAARLTALKIVALDLWLLICPVQLASDRQYNQIPIFHAGDLFGWIGLAVVAAILAAVVLRARKDPVLFWAAGFFAIVLLPASNLVVLIGSIMAERFLYLPALGFAIAAAALLFRLNSRTPVIILSAAILLFAARASVRNEAWRDDLSLTSTDVRVVPDNLHFHTALASTLFAQDPRGNLDSAIREQEIGVGIMRDLPPDRLFVPAVADLGMMYGQKAEAMGGSQTTEGRSWYAKSLETLLRARAASQLGEKAYDAAQIAHGRPVGKRSAYGRLYGVLGATYGKLGRFPESIEAYQYARALDPEAPGPYIDLANGYVNAGDWPSAAVTLLEQGLALGFSPDTVRAIGAAYTQVGGGECALQAGGGIPMLNSGCPKVRADFCPALAGLAKVFTEGREPERARAFRETAARQYGCPIQ